MLFITCFDLPFLPCYDFSFTSVVFLFFCWALFQIESISSQNAIPKDAISKIERHLSPLFADEIGLFTSLKLSPPAYIQTATLNQMPIFTNDNGAIKTNDNGGIKIS